MFWRIYSNIQLSSVAQSCPTLCDPMDHSTPDFPVYHQLLELAQTHIHWASDAIQPSHPLSSLSPPAFSPSHHEGLLKWVSSSHHVAKVLELQLQHQSFQWIFRTDFLLGWTGWISLQSKRHSNTETHTQWEMDTYIVRHTHRDTCTHLETYTYRERHTQSEK